MSKIDWRDVFWLNLFCISGSTQAVGLWTGSYLDGLLCGSYICGAFTVLALIKILLSPKNQ